MTTCGPIATLREIKKGDSFSYGGTVTGMAAGVTGTGQINDPLNEGTLVATLVITFDAYVDALTPRPFRIDLASGQVTDAWPIGMLRGDLKFSEPGGFVIHSKTFAQPVVHAETV